MPDSLKRAIALNVRRLRKTVGISQAALAGAADLHVNTIKELEAGRANLELATIQKIADALGADPSELLAPVDPVSEEAVAESLAAFLASDLAADVTESERAELQRVRWPYSTPTVAVWFHLLQALRASSKK